jgi:hypothetical protein
MVKKKKSRRVWQLVPSKPPKPDVPESTKIFLSREANKVIETVIKPKYLEPPPTDNDFNYIADIYSRWYRNYFYFVAKYNCPSPNAISPSFESKYVRSSMWAKTSITLPICGILVNGGKPIVNFLCWNS